MKICYCLPWSQPSLGLIIPPACLGSITASLLKFTQKIQTLEKCSELWATCINIKLVFFLVLHCLWPNSILHAQGVVSYCCWFSSKCYAGLGLVFNSILKWPSYSTCVYLVQKSVLIPSTFLLSTTAVNGIINTGFHFRHACWLSSDKVGFKLGLGEDIKNRLQF